MPIILAMAEPPPAAVAPASTPNPVTAADWLRKPTGEDLARYYPSSARRVSLSGRTRLDCHVTADGKLAACAAWANPADDPSFAEAALKLAPLFLMKAVDRNLASVAGRPIHIPIWFRLPAARAPDIVLSQPSLPTGSAELDCRATPPNTVDNCMVVSAVPAGRDVDKLALEFAERLKVNTPQQTRFIQRLTFKSGAADPS
jgi:hypothetical protein